VTTSPPAPKQLTPPPQPAPSLRPLELGVDTFGDVTRGADGQLLSQAQVLRDVVDEAVLADQVGIDVFSVGEHHRADFAIAAPEVMLAAIAARTKRIRLGSAVTVLSTDEPVRVYQRFVTLDAVSGGRAEVTLGRGSFTETFPLFGYSMDQYEKLFEERLELFVSVLESARTGNPVTWRGSTRPPLSLPRIYPIAERPLTTWVGVGGSPESVVRAARYGLPLMLAIIGGNPLRFQSYVALYHRALEEFGIDARPIGVHSPGYVAETDAQAREELWPAWRDMRTRIGAERGWPPATRNEFERDVEEGALHVGSPETVARRVTDTIQTLGLARFDLKYSAGALSHDKMRRCIELYGQEVIPRVRANIGSEVVTA
jgi:probable LLM family oxidoreductase